MNTFITDIQPIMLTALVGVIIAYARYVNALKTRVAVLERTIEDLLKTIDGMQKRLDSHSKKQDEFVDLINDLKLEMVKQISGMSSELNTIATDVRSINRMFRADDEGITIKRIPHNK